MKRILITGANSYVGTSVEKWLNQWPEKYDVTTIDMIGDVWRSISFSEYDVIFHVAGIAHSDTRRISKEQEHMYRAANTELTIETALKAKTEGVKQFIFMSSAIVYGDSAPIGKIKIITRDTIPNPANCYGNSKLQAELGIQKLVDENFSVAIVRSPMVYGKGSKGNYPILAKMALRLPFFPKVDNQRSMIYIENLALFIQLVIDNEETGIFWPQNNEYTSTSQMAYLIAKAHDKHMCLVKGFNWVLYLMRPFLSIVDKAFGSLTYDQQLSVYDKGFYSFVDFETSIRKTESHL